MPRVTGVDHLVLSVSDFARSKAFYGPLMDFLGFEIMDEMENAMGWRNDVTRLWIYQADEEGKTAPYRKGNPGFHHYAWSLGSRAEVDELQQWLETHNAAIVDPADEYYPDYYAVFFLDPDGMKLEGMYYGK